MIKSQLISIEDRIYTFSKIYHCIITYFSGWQNIPEFNLDSIYKDYIGKVIKITDRYSFGLEIMEFLALLNNGNCKFKDSFIDETYGGSLGFKLSFYDGKWIIRDSQIEELQNYEIVHKIDDEEMEAFFQRQKKYICSFNDRDAKVKLSAYSSLFPKKFKLTLANGTVIDVDRTNYKNIKPKVEGMWIKEGEIACIKLPSFETLEFEDKAIEYVQSFKDAKHILFDLRDNNGGITPQRLIKVLMDRPYRFWSESTPINFGFFKNFGEHIMPQDDLSPTSILRCFEKSSLMWPAYEEVNFTNVYSGKLSFIVDATCSSNCEDFIIPFKDNKRATILGEKTMGCTGFPYVIEFENGISVSIPSKRPFFPDGSVFDGVGISPDIGIHLSIDDLRNSRDGVLMEAIRMTSMFMR